MNHSHQHGSSALYAMIKPPLAPRASLCGCRAAQGLDTSYPPDRLHSTMLRLGDGDDWPAAALDRLLQSFDELRFDPFVVTYDQLEGMLLRGRMGLPAPALLHRTLRRHAERCGVALPDHRFWLHLSLAYRGAAPTGVRKIEPISWLVEDFRLIRSIKGIGHEELGRWPLIARQMDLFA